MADGGTLAVDISTRALGWCCGPTWLARPHFGLYRLGGMKDLGKLYRSVCNALAEVIELHDPARLIWAPAFYNPQTAALALNGVAAMAELTAYDYGISPFTVPETTARLEVLGRGTFGQRDARGKLIKGTGSKAAKEAALNWCGLQGWLVQSDDVADAAVLWECDRRWRLHKMQGVHQEPKKRRGQPVGRSLWL